MAVTDYTKLLAEALDAKHKLMTGTAVVRVNRGGVNGMSVEYTRANLFELNAYIAELERLSGSETRRRPPAGVSF